MVIGKSCGKYDLVPAKDKMSGTVYCYDYRLGNKLNRLLGNYGDYRMQPGEEAIFKFSDKQWMSIKKVLRIKG